MIDWWDAMDEATSYHADMDAQATTTDISPVDRHGEPLW